MTDRLRLVIFDVDGTLVDSQADIAGAMRIAFGTIGAEPPEREAVLGIVGLSLPQAMEVLAPDCATSDHQKLVEAYKEAYVSLRSRADVSVTSPLYPGALEVLDQLKAQDLTLLGIATGKSRRGLDVLVQAHELDGYFINQQVSDFHPSKPHPAMLQAALSETGFEAAQAVMIGDTSYDMDMARAAGVAGLGVSWGYHDKTKLIAAGARRIVDRFDEVPRAVDELLKVTA